LLTTARENNVSFEELEKISGTGSEGRITKKDLEKHIQMRNTPPNSSEERVKMSGIRKAIADNMVKSFYEAPHASLISEVDVTEVMRYIKQEKAAFLEEKGYKLSITSFIAKAIATAVKEFPFINASLENDTIVLKKSINLGIAVSVDQGIQVPVIRSCQEKNITEIAKEVASLSEKARSNALLSTDVKDGTITMTNFGMSGTLIGIPIIRHPEVAIIGIGAIHKKVVALEDDSIVVRSMMHVSLTFDHRVLDGMYGCAFLGALKSHIESDLSLGS
ncbi:MAG: 2-oxo acid dehydrogenase subunit E2, partial [Simkaniaceae bacterium]|nr:2-oxo acid dehydrogenase subunit E2 [Simkaniaceae bacterium]